MRDILSNPYFMAFVLLGVGNGLWYLLDENKKEVKQSILSIFTDFVFYFILTALGMNVVFHFREMIAMPYRILLLSSNVVALATLLVTIYGAVKYGTKMWQQPHKTKSVAQLFILLALTNHIYLYYLYSTLQTLLFVLFFMAQLAILTFTQPFKKIDPLVFFTGTSLIHFILMGSQPTIYYNFAFYPLPLLGILLTLTVILHIQRRKLQSKPN